MTVSLTFDTPGTLVLPEDVMLLDVSFCELTCVLFDDIDELFDHIEELFDDIEELFDHIEELFDHIDELFDHIEELFDHIDELFDGMIVLEGTDMFDSIDALLDGINTDTLLDGILALVPIVMLLGGL